LTFQIFWISSDSPIVRRMTNCTCLPSTWQYNYSRISHLYVNLLIVWQIICPTALFVTAQSFVVPYDKSFVRQQVFVKHLLHKLGLSYK